MQHKLEKLMRKKAEKGDVLSKSHAKARSGILQDLAEDMMAMEGDKVKGLKKVTIASDTSKGLKKGVEKAEEMLDEEMPEGEEMAEGEEMEEGSEESPEMEVAENEGEEKEVEDLKAEIEKLKEKLAKHNLA